MTSGTATGRTTAWSLLANAEKPVAMRGDHKSELMVHIMIES
jgi:hypothetical protein